MTTWFGHFTAWLLLAGCWLAWGCLTWGVLVTADWIERKVRR